MYLLEDERKGLEENHVQMIENCSKNFELLVNGGFSFEHLHMILKTRLGSDVTISYPVRKSLHKYFPQWWKDGLINDIIDLANESIDLDANDTRHQSLLNDNGKLPTEIIHQMKRDLSTHREKVNAFFTDHTLKYTESPDGSDAKAFICFDSECLDQTAVCEICARASTALLQTMSKTYDIVLVPPSAISVTDKGVEVNQVLTAQHHETCEYPITLTCTKCPQLAKAITSSDKKWQGTDSPDYLPFLHQFP